MPPLCPCSVAFLGWLVVLAPVLLALVGLDFFVLAPWQERRRAAERRRREWSGEEP